jgi:hypothetical protein
MGYAPMINPGSERGFLTTEVHGTTYKWRAGVLLPVTGSAALRAELAEAEKQKKAKEEAKRKQESCCYITSACLDDLDLSRDCPEMQAMKTLTKEHILKSFSGKRDYVRYGKIAPRIVQSVRSKSDYRETWKQVYETLREVTCAVASGNYVEGQRKYKAMVLGLESRFMHAVA